MKIFTPNVFYKKFLKIVIGSSILTVLFLILGLYYSFYDSPEDHQQGNLVRIMYVHVPSAWMSLLLYSFMTFCSIIFLVKKVQISYFMHVASSYTGCVFTALTLITGSIWGKPTWGTWWVWDSRLTSVFILFLFYLSNLIIINSNKKNIMRSAFPSSVFTILGFINIPVVKFSVNIWNGMHQKSSIIKIGGPSIAWEMLLPLIIMTLGFLFISITMVFIKTSSLLKKARFSSNTQYSNL